ncbi:hypothetical protein [Nonomuraea basaltis]|uniref:hypothetical protein n=1 Tax=Nonomuraea basaltis TaxID=2495887 RepID=UPI0014869AA9|nr:hypothetical protein [Nonomuraea basaltis]
MKASEIAEIICDGCGKPGKVAKSLLKADAPVKVKHAPKAGGCGLKTTIRK